MPVLIRDSRLRYTRQCLYDSFLVLLEAKPVSAITVVEICEGAGVSRKTFYKYYSDPYALLVAMQDDLFGEYKEALSESVPNVYDIAPLLIRFVDGHRVLVRAVFENRGEGNFVDRVLDDMFATYHGDWEQANPEMTAQDVEFLFHYVVSGLVGVVRHWLFDRPDMDVEAVCAYAARLMTLSDPHGRAKAECAS